MQLAAAPALTIRPIDARDRAALMAAFDHLGDESRFRRYGTVAITAERALRWLDGGEDGFALGADATGFDVPVGVARYVALDPGLAEVAVTVIDPAQGRGIGGLLARAILRQAYDRGVETMTAFISTDNGPALRLMRRLGGRPHGRAALGMLELRVPLSRAVDPSMD